MDLHNRGQCYTMRQWCVRLDRLIGFMTDGRLSGFLDILDQRIRLIKLSPDSSSSPRIMKEDVSFTKCSSFNSDRLQRLKHVSCHRNWSHTGYQHAAVRAVRLHSHLIKSNANVTFLRRCNTRNYQISVSGSESSQSHRENSSFNLISSLYFTIFSHFNYFFLNYNFPEVILFMWIGGCG